MNNFNRTYAPSIQKNIMMKLLPFVIFLLFTSLCHSQSKKDQIQTLTVQVDSLDQLLKQEYNKFNDLETKCAQKEVHLSTQISALNNQLTSVQQDAEKSQALIRQAELKNKKLEEQLLALNLTLKNKSDSIALLNLQIASENINFTDLEKYYTADSLFSFEAPRGFFISTKKGLQARDRDFDMETQTFVQIYPCDPEEEILTVKSLQEKFMQGIQVTYKTAKSDFFVVSGLDLQDRIVYIKGDYTELQSMQGRDEGEPTRVWSKAGVIQFSYPQDKKTDFNRVVEIITNSLQVNHDMM